MLGALGDVNKIDDPAIHASVFEHLCDLQDTLSRVGSLNIETFIGLKRLELHMALPLEYAWGMKYVMLSFIT